MVRTWRSTSRRSSPSTRSVIQAHAPPCEVIVDPLRRNRRYVPAPQFRTTTVAARVHLLFAPVDQREVEVADHHALAGSRTTVSTGLAVSFRKRSTERCL